jgi:hypothetical protein
MAAASLAGCGAQSPPPVPEGSQTATASPTPTVLPDVLVEQASKMTLDAPSKRIVGSAAVGGHGVEFDVTFVGNDAKGTKLSTAPGISMTIEFARVGEDLFIKANEHYWQSYYNLEVLQYLVNKWVRVDADDPSYADLVVLQASDQMTPVGPVTRTGSDTIDGTPVVVLKDDKGSTFFVAAEGKPYLVRFATTQASAIGIATVMVTFSEFGAVSQTITAPAGEIFDPERDFPEIAVGRD